MKTLTVTYEDMIEEVETPIDVPYHKSQMQVAAEEFALRHNINGLVTVESKTVLKFLVNVCRSTSSRMVD